MNDTFYQILNTATKFKNVMLKQNKIKAYTNCPLCEKGKLYGYISGTKKHFHMRCDSCPTIFME